jgi:hypothetical protein
MKESNSALRSVFKSSLQRYSFVSRPTFLIVWWGLVRLVTATIVGVY